MPPSVTRPETEAPGASLIDTPATVPPAETVTGVAAAPSTGDVVADPQ